MGYGKPALWLINHLRDETENLPCLGMTLGLQFGVDQLPVRADLEPAFARGDKNQHLDDMLVILQQLVCQAHGPARVMSDCAVDDLDLQHFLLQKT